ncbi:MAG TPA: PEPxxWA-CTERM sorting domain-containing protein, partial [Phenylobacterium sp.]
SGTFAFSSTGGRNIAGVSVFTSDPGGLGYDNLLSDIPSTGGGGVPEPSVWALMLGGFGLAGAMLRRRSLRAAH